MKQPITILIADDHALLRRGLATLLGFAPGLSVVGDAKNGEEAVKAAIKLKPDVVVMDLSMPVMDGVEATRRIREKLPETHVLILTTYSTSVDVVRAMDAGASGAFVKDADDDRLIEAIRTVASEGTAFSPEIESMIKTDPHPPELTERQQKILEATSKGLSSEQIASRLGISAYAVNQHLDVIRRKLGAQSRTEAVAIAIRKHLLKI
ncbi:MAG: response regulator transcription factor [Kiritimatiellae bacterium]|nr:response regulator transcription factor [Kiritimatiellia bacterium]